VSGLFEIGGTGTSTIASNLQVWGDLYAKGLFVGDLVFANAFRFVEYPLPIDRVLQEGTQSLVLKNQKGEDILSIDEYGNLKIAGSIQSDEANEKISIISESLAWVIEQFENIGIKIARGVIQLREIIADKITTKKVVTDGLEMKDSVTGDVYCVRISNGEWDKFKGTCGEIPNEIISNEQNKEEVQQATEPAVKELASPAPAVQVVEEPLAETPPAPEVLKAELPTSSTSPTSISK
jgi:hypothetical protein